MANKKPRRNVIENLEVLDTGDFHVLIVRDPCAGKPDRVTVWKIPAKAPLANKGGAEIIGRELDLNFARELAHNRGQGKKE